MAESEKITGRGITRIFEELRLRKTLLKLNLVDTDFNCLVRITGLKQKKSGLHFVIELPQGFKEAAADIDTWQLCFEFTGSDNIYYVFPTSGGRITGNQIYIKLPGEVDRKQRRKLFRIHTPAETKLCFSIDTDRHELEVIDISLGGSLAAIVQTGGRIRNNPPFPEIQALKDVELVFPTEIGGQCIKIKTAQIKRVEKNPETSHYEMALEFDEISKQDENLLNDMIYRLQRQYLRKRLPLDI